MGKCFSACNQGQRNKSDFYQTPLSMTRQLLEVEKFIEPILEPASGKQAIVKVLKESFSNVIFYDIETNFFNEKKKYASIITNPPFSLAGEFIKKAKETADKIAMLLPLSYLHGQKRFEEKIFQNLKCIYVFTRYPMLTDDIREDGKYTTGMQVYAWFIWEINYNKPAVIKWLNNNEFVLNQYDIKLDEMTEEEIEYEEGSLFDDL
jgi:hypothetical protein